MLKELYQEVIIDHNRNPRNHCALDNATHHAEGYNALCGDKLELYLIIKNKVIEKVTFEGEGCAISTATASLMTDMLKGRTLEEAQSLFKKFHAMMMDEKIDDMERLGKLAVLAGVKDYPMRIKCATLAWHTLKAALDKDTSMVTTE